MTAQTLSMCTGSRFARRSGPAVRPLAKARNDLQAVDVLEAEPVRRPKSRVIAGTSLLLPQGGALGRL